MRARFTWTLVAGGVLFQWLCSAQDLGELARRERQRRAVAAPVRYRIDNLSAASTADATASANARPGRQASPGNREPGSAPSKTVAQAVNNKQINDLIRRGPIVWLELSKTTRRLAELEKELNDLERTSSPTWRRGIRLENPTLEKKRREVQACRRRLQELDQEWKWLQDRARRLNLAPGLLRGYR